jgi:hypothetical protein
MAFECIHAIQTGSAARRKFCAYKSVWLRGLEVFGRGFSEIGLSSSMGTVVYGVCDHRTLLLL